MKKRIYQDKIWTPLFMGVIFVSICCTLSSMGGSAALPVYIVGIGGTAAFSGLLNTAFALSAGVGRAVGGTLSARRGRRPVILAGLALY